MFKLKLIRNLTEILKDKVFPIQVNVLGERQNIDFSVNCRYFELA